MRATHAVIEDQIQHDVLMRAAPEVVYDALATAAGLDAWFTTGATVDARPGGEIVFRWKEWGPARVTLEDAAYVLEAQQPERLAFEWHPDSADYATTVSIRCEAVEGGTVVRLRERGYRQTPAGLRAMLACAVGWGEALTLCKVYVEHGIRY